MLLRSIETALALQCGPVAVAVGRATESMRQTIAAKKLLLIEDVQFLDGQGAAIRKGLSSLLLHTPHLKGLLVTSCDQPLVNARSLRDLIHAETLLAASAYLGTSGAPVWFGRPLFDELLSLQDHDGIRPLVDAHRRDLTTVSIPEAAIDIETFASLAALAP
jgi:molybdenum cofactor cytidylyltransferase